MEPERCALARSGGGPWPLREAGALGVQGSLVLSATLPGGVALAGYLSKYPSL